MLGLLVKFQKVLSWKENCTGSLIFVRLQYYIATTITPSQFMVTWDWSVLGPLVDSTRSVLGPLVDSTRSVLLPLVDSTRSVLGPPVDSTRSVFDQLTNQESRTDPVDSAIGKRTALADSTRSVHD